MTEQDRKTLEEIRCQTRITTNCELATTRQLKALIAIIDRLDKQLTEIKDAGEPFEEYAKHFVGLPDCTGDPGLYEGGKPLLTVGDFRRLVQALKR